MSHSEKIPDYPFTPVSASLLYASMMLIALAYPLYHILITLVLTIEQFRIPRRRNRQVDTVVAIRRISRWQMGLACPASSRTATPDGWVRRETRQLKSQKMEDRRDYSGLS